MDLDPDADPDPAIFVTDPQDGNKNMWIRIRIRNRIRNTVGKYMDQISM